MHLSEMSCIVFKVCIPKAFYKNVETGRLHIPTLLSSICAMQMSVLTLYSMCLLYAFFFF